MHGQGPTESAALEDGQIGGRMLKLLKDLPKARTAPDKTAIERQIAVTDRQIDQMVYELYGLTEEKIRIMEGERE
jgi:hypothetical protein